MQLPAGIGVVAVCVVVGGGGGGVVAVWVVTGGGGGGVVAVWVVTGGGGGAVAVVCVVITGAVALCATVAWWTWCFGFGFGVVAVVDVVEDVLVVVVVAAALGLWVDVELDDADPHALTNSVSRTAASGMRMCLMLVKDAAADGLLPESDGRRGSEQAMNAAARALESRPRRWHNPEHGGPRPRLGAGRR